MKKLRSMAQRARADVNGDGKLAVTDVLLACKYIAGSSKKL